MMRSRRDTRARSIAAIGLFTLTALAITVALPAPSAATGGTPIRLEGYWDPVEDDMTVLGTLTLRDDRGTVRVFAVTDARAFHAADHGMPIFRHTALRPALNLRGSTSTVEPFVDGRGGEATVVLGVYKPRYADIVVTDVAPPPMEGTEPGLETRKN